MPSTSKKQQRLFGLALSVKRGDTPRSEASQQVLDIVDSMSEKKIKDFASKVKGESVHRLLKRIIREEIQKLKEYSDTPSKTMDAFARIGNSKRAARVDGQRVDPDTAVMAWRIWDMANDTLRQKLNKMNGKELYNAVHKIKRNM